MTVLRLAQITEEQGGARAAESLRQLVGDVESEAVAAKLSSFDARSLAAGLALGLQLATVIDSRC